ncbi:MAG: TolC family protein [Bacteroidota bacterium]
MRYKVSIKAAGIAALLLLAGQGAMAQVKQLSLAQAMELSLQNSKQLKLSNAKVEEAVANTREMWNNHLPDVKVTGTYMRLNNPDVSLKMKTSSSSTGGGEEQGAVKVNQVAYGIANASLPLFSGFRIKYGVESARYLEQAARLDGESEKEEVIQNAVAAYSNLYKAHIAVSLVKENLNAQKQRVADFSNLERNGVMARNDLLKAQLQQSNIELSLLDAENNLAVTTANMDLMLGLDDNTRLVPDSLGYLKLEDAGTLLQWEQTALHNRKDVASLSYREKAAYSAIKATKGEYYPGIALTGGLIAADIPDLLTVTNAFNAGLGLSYNIGSLWKTGAKVDAAKARLHQVQATEGMMGDQVRIQVSQAYHNYLLSVRKISVYERAVEQATENYRITKNKYDNSLSTTTDLLDADTARLQAQLNFATSKADATTAYKRLQQVAGVLK